MISTHTPHAGCDLTTIILYHRYPKFQLTHPMRGATTNAPSVTSVKSFQLTHPMRGATQGIPLILPLDQISTHTPHAGCDSVWCRHYSQGADFNSHTPCGVRRVFVYLVSTLLYFNSHTPCGVRHNVREAVHGAVHFNSHTPCGVRRGRGNIRHQRNHFNSHTPCGVRHGTISVVCGIITFQLTHPMRGATAARRRYGYRKEFQLTHPMRGATRSRRAVLAHFLFQLTHPMRGATVRPALVSLYRSISTHTPHAGCDAVKVEPLTVQHIISTHTPHAGCDLS